METLQNVQKETLQNKIDFTLIITATDANPNGDPLDGNRPRTTPEGYGEMSPESIKRKIRNRLQDMGYPIFVQSDDRCDDGFKSLRARAEGFPALKEIANGKKTDSNKFAEIACENWADVRYFGQVFAFKGVSESDVNEEENENKKSKKKKGKKDTSFNNVSVGVRGPVSIRQAISVSPVNIISTKITKSTNGEDVGEEKASDTMGWRHRVAFGAYVIQGSISCQLAEKTGFTEDDALALKEALLTLFENDSSAARPDGSMEVCRLYWWKHDCKMPKATSASVHRAVKITLKDGVDEPKSIFDYDIDVDELDGVVKPEVYNLV